MKKLLIKEFIKPYILKEYHYVRLYRQLFLAFLMKGSKIKLNVFAVLAPRGTPPPSRKKKNFQHFLKRLFIGLTRLITMRSKPDYVEFILL